MKILIHEYKDKNKRNIKKEYNIEHKPQGGLCLYNFVNLVYIFLCFIILFLSSYILLLMIMVISLFISEELYILYLIYLCI